MALLCFDLDGTLCTNTGGEYDRAEPFRWAIVRVNRLASAGHRILIYTARGTATGIDWEAVTRDQLARWGVSYHELRFGKPSATVFVDDRAVHTEAWRCGPGFGTPALPITDPTPGSAETLPTVLGPAVSAVVESGRTFAGRPARLEQHAARVLALARAAAIRHLPGAADIRAAAQAALAAAGDEPEMSYSICVSDGAQLIHRHAQASGSAPRIAVSCRDLREVCESISAMSTGIDLALRAATGDPRPDAWPLERAAAGTYSAGLGARMCLVTSGQIAIEPGAGPEEVAVGWLRELVAPLGVAMTERALTPEDVSRADEGFLVGLPFCVLALASIDGRELDRPPGAVTAGVLEAWSSAVGMDIAAQLDDLARPPAAPPAPGRTRQVTGG